MIEFSDDEKLSILSFISELIEKKIEIPLPSPKIELSEESKKIKESRSTQKIFSFFLAHGYHIIGLTEIPKLPRDLVRLASLLTKNRELVYPFIKDLLHTDKAQFALECENSEDRAKLLNLCHSFAKKEWLEFQYKKNEKSIFFKRLPGLNGKVKNFLSGIFGEYGTAKLIEKALQDFSKARNGFKYKIFHDIKLKRTDSDHQCDMQLDLVIQLPEGYYIFETKMGDVLAIDKWVDRTRLFASEKNRYITCCANETLNPRVFAPFRLFTLKNLHEQMLKQLNRDYPLSCQQSSETVPSVDAST